MNGLYFRAAVGAIIVNNKGQVLLLERSDFPGTWQFVQGGINFGERPSEAVLREIKEETSIDADKLKFVASHPSWLSYSFTKGKPSLFREENCRVPIIGQTQKWFIYALSDESAIDLDNAQDKEFKSYRWADFEDAVKYVSGFKKELYISLFAWANRIIRAYIYRINKTDD